jgi:hypothetical protein
MNMDRWNKDCQIWKVAQGVTLDTPVKGVDYDLKYLKLTPDGRLEIRPRYAWNGCSPKAAIMGVVWGTPEGALPREKEEHLIKKNLEAIGYPQLDWYRPRTYYATLVHDSFYKISEKHAAEMDRKGTNESNYPFSGRMGRCQQR